MSRDIGPTCKDCRRFEQKLCSRPPSQCAYEKKRRQGGRTFSKRLSDFGLQLKEKQKARVIYGIKERQFRRYYEKATKVTGVTGEEIIKLLEQRLDNVVYRSGFCTTRAQARQWVNHGHFTVNNRKVNVPSYNIKINDTIEWKLSSRKKPIYEQAKTELTSREPPSWLDIKKNELKITIKTRPELTEQETNLETRLIVEYYSRR